MQYRYGLDYSSQYWMYSDSDATLDGDFSFFQSKKINLICPWVHWSNLEPDQNQPSQTHLANLKRMINKAALYGIDVDFDFHSSAGMSQTYGMPPWLKNPLPPAPAPNGLGMTWDSILASASWKQHYIDLMKTTINYLLASPNPCTNIRSFQLFNEMPDNADYVPFFNDAAAQIKAITQIPVAIRMGVWQFANFYYNYSWAAFNFVGINCYLYSDTAGHTEANLDFCLNHLAAQGLPCEITEYGLNSPDDELQRQATADSIAFFKSRGIENTLITQYGRFYSANDYNLRRTDGTARPAFDEVAAANTWGALPLPFHDDFTSLSNLQVINGTWT